MTAVQAFGVLPLVSLVAVAGEIRGAVGNADVPDAIQGLREACHDMRQPVAGVLAIAGAALTDPALPRVVRDRLEQIVEQAECLTELIQAWLQAGQSTE